MRGLRTKVRFAVVLGSVALGLVFAQREVEKGRTRRAIRTTVQSSPDRVEAQLGHPLRPAVRALAADLAEHGMVPARARRLAPYIISLSAYFDLSPSLVFGVMLTENREFTSTARSNVGATGLMQLMPSTYAGLARTCGADVTNDVSNVCAGIHVLAENLRRTNGNLEQALLRYNGCVRGTNTPNCFTYPHVVLRHVAEGRWQCPEADPRTCVARIVSWHSPSSDSGTL